MKKEKILKIILTVILSIILLILLIFIIQNFIKIDSYEEKETTITSTTKENIIYTEVDSSIEVMLNGNYNTRIINYLLLEKVENINLLQSERAKFAYVYFYLTEKELDTTLDNINIYVEKFFKTTLQETNISQYKVDERYTLSTTDDEYYEVKVLGKRNNMIYLSINDNLASITYEENDNELIIKTFKYVE